MAILITGASAGFGEAMCRAFTAAGFNVVGAARRMEKLQALAEELGGSFYPLQMDVADTSSVPAALQSLPEGFREIDCLINNAGLALGLNGLYSVAWDSRPICSTMATAKQSAPKKPTG